VFKTATRAIRRNGWRGRRRDDQYGALVLLADVSCHYWRIYRLVYQYKAEMWEMFLLRKTTWWAQ
jgi:hypothetical protein